MLGKKILQIPTLQVLKLCYFFQKKNLVKNPKIAFEEPKIVKSFSHDLCSKWHVLSYPDW